LIEKTAKELNKALKETNEAKEYFALKEAIAKDKYLTTLIENITSKQKEMKEYLKKEDLVNYKLAKATLLVYEDAFKNHPLINNYLVVKDNLYDLIYQVVNIISE